jgi:hypothetical protein
MFNERRWHWTAENHSSAPEFQTITRAAHRIDLATTHKPVLILNKFTISTIAASPVKIPCHFN